MKKFGYRGLFLSLAFSVMLLGGWTSQAAAAEELVFASWGALTKRRFEKLGWSRFLRRAALKF